MGNPEKARVPGEVSGRIAGARPGAGLWFDFRVLEDHRAATRGHVGVRSVQRVQGRGLGAPKPRGARLPETAATLAVTRAKALVVQGRMEGSVWGCFEGGAGRSADGNSSQRDPVASHNLIQPRPPACQHPPSVCQHPGV